MCFYRLLMTAFFPGLFLPANMQGPARLGAIHSEQLNPDGSGNIDSLFYRSLVYNSISLPDTFKLAPSSWPIYHANTYATASSPNRSPGMVQRFQEIRSLTNRRLRKPGVSPWTVLAEPYADGSQAVLTTPANGVAKYLIQNNELKAIDFLPLQRGPLEINWGILVLKGGLGVVTEKGRNHFVIFGDAGPKPDSPLEVKWRIPIDKKTYGELSSHFSLAPDGRLIALTEDSRLIAVDLQEKKVVSSFELPSDAGTSFHNSFPIDEGGRLFLSTQNLILAVDWDGKSFSLAWRADYDMRGPGCEEVPIKQSKLKEALAVSRGEPCTGSGTTPTLIGNRRDGIVLIVDGHSPKNNLVAFWRNSPPDNWQALADPTGRKTRLHPQVAAILPLPYSTPDGKGFSSECSPAALGNTIITAQWAGFSPDPDSPKGVQRIDWNPAKKVLELVWANPDIQFNGVPTIACSAAEGCHTYGMGRYPDGYIYTSLNLETGKVSGQVKLGSERAVLDQGNGHAVAADGSIVYSGRFSMIRVW